MKELLEYIDNSEDPQINFNIGEWYENQGYVSPAVSFYLRCADRSDDINLRYKALLKIFVCYDKAGDRDFVAKSALQSAVALCPYRIEAYFLLCQFHEYRTNYIDSYMNASIAISLLPKKYEVEDFVKYPGDHALYFLKACSAWHVGKPDESRQIYRYILENMSDDLDKTYKDLLQLNLSQLGSGGPAKAFTGYNKKNNTLKYKFDGCEEIEQNHSQVFQDICTLTLLDGKKSGTYLEIGAADPFYGSNTALLEKLGWKGIGIEYDENFVALHKIHRENKVLCQNALDVDYEDILKEISPNSNIIDYLQLDIEPSKNTFMALTLLPTHKYKFRFITYEHDHYADVTKSFREKSRSFLRSLGYKLLINDISPFGDHSFEDWWYHPDLVDQKRVDMIQHVDLNAVHAVENIFLK
jgi:tetratricopeptide (TPR) repeat protein